MAHSDFPVKKPLITDVLAESIHREMMAEESLAFAFPTTFRHSDAGKCGRYLWYQHLDTDPSDPIDLSGAWVMWIGKMLHAELQRCLPERFPGCKVEVSVRHGELSSGHLDAFIILEDGTRICYELKTNGSFAFDKAVGLNRKAWATKQPEGPKSSARIQGALNATAKDADLLIIGVMGLEAVSKGLADKIGWGDLARTIGEWHFEKAEFSPWAEREIARLAYIKMQLEEGIVPDRIAIGDEMEAISLSPNASKVPWQCQYCSHFTSCKEAP